MDNRRRYLNVLRKMNMQDEAKVSEALRKKGFYTNSDNFPLSALHFELTEACNAKCRHCYNSSGHNEHDKMGANEWIKFAKYLVEKGGVFECLLSSGEPLLLGKRLFEIMDILDDDGTIFMLMTNGFLVTDEVSTHLAKYKYHWLQVSIDGSDAEYHDWFRQSTGSWEHAINAVKCLSNKNIPVKIAHCVTPQNIDKIDDMFKLASEIGASSIIAGGISLSGRTSDNRNLLLTPDQDRFLWEKIKENRVIYDGRMTIKTTNSVKQGLINHSEKPRSNAVIRPNGDIRIDDMAPFVIGNVLRDDFETIWSSKIDTCWKDPRVVSFINGFDRNDRNTEIINYVDDDIYL